MSASSSPYPPEGETNYLKSVILNGMEKKMFLDATKPVFENATLLRKNMTPAEKELWNYLRPKPLGFKFRKQHTISKYIADFYCHSLKLIIEIDGGIHSLNTVSEKDRIRQDFLESEGAVFLRFTNTEIFTGLEKVKSKIEQFLQQVKLCK